MAIHKCGTISQFNNSGMHRTPWPGSRGTVDVGIHFKETDHPDPTVVLSGAAFRKVKDVRETMYNGRRKGNNVQCWGNNLGPVGGRAPASLFRNPIVINAAAATSGVRFHVCCSIVGAVPLQSSWGGGGGP